MTGQEIARFIQPQGEIIVPKLEEVEMYGRSILASGLQKISKIIDDIEEPTEIKLKAMNTAANISKYISSRIDAQPDIEDMLDDSEDYGIGEDGEA